MKNRETQIWWALRLLLKIALIVGVCLMAGDPTVNLT